ncbi:hypothetical protein GCM10027426_19530 [Microbacterium lacusdiani]
MIRTLGIAAAVVRRASLVSEERLSTQRHIRQHMPTRPGIMIPAVPFASEADRRCALTDMLRL